MNQPPAPIDLQRILRVAKNQRSIMFCILAQLGIGIEGYLVKPPALVQSGLSLLVGIVSIVFTVALARVVYGVFGVVVCVVLLLVPFVGAFATPDVAGILPLVSLFTLLIVNQRATKELRAAGFSVGLMGGDPAEVEARIRAERPGA